MVASYQLVSGVAPSSSSSSSPLIMKSIKCCQLLKTI
jgi:hypothetical protein